MAEIKFSTEKNGKGIRYVKRYKKQRFRSQTYVSDTRDNRRDASKEFEAWKQVQENKVSDNVLYQRDVKEGLIWLHKQKQDYWRMVGDTQEANRLQQIIDSVPQADSNEIGRIHNDYEQDRDENQELHQFIVGTINGIRRQRGVAEETGETNQLIDQWLKFRLSEAKTDTITAGTVDNNRRQVEQFARFCPDITQATNLRFTEFRQYLQEKIANGESPYTCRDTLATVKSFLDWCGDVMEVISPLTVLRKRGMGIKVPTKKKISIWTDEAVKKLLSITKGQQRLYYLLMLNTGAYESDIGTWTQEAFDGDFITYKRHKVNRAESVPTVTYPLWPETKRLLTEYRSTHSECLLTTANGTPLWNDKLKEGEDRNKRSRKNVIGKQFGRLKKKHPEFGTLKDLRKTAASKLGENAEYVRFAQYFAGQSPRTTIDRFYKQPNQKQFNEAVLWLGEQF